MRVVWFSDDDDGAEEDGRSQSAAVVNLSSGQSMGQTPSTGVRHPSFNHCRVNFSYATESRKLSVNEQFLLLVSVQTVVSLVLLQTTQIISDVLFYN